ncbi:MAG TPA: hypothetical protein VEK11_24925 [Thermoanaerobaculia bacterium]|nr:hypothetical protein [Thermoanaerobaculia bacterium]
MSLTRTLAVFVSLLSATGLYAEGPRMEFGAGPPKIRGIAVGTRIAWIAMLRERIAGQSHMTILRGVEPVTPNGDLALDRADRDFSRSLWLIAELTGPAVVRDSAPQYAPTAASIFVRAVKDEETITVHATSVHIAWIRRTGEAVWNIAATDGSELDADTIQNGVITIPLSIASAFRGNARPPQFLAPGDLLLLIDPDENRTSVIEVAE